MADRVLSDHDRTRIAFFAAKRILYENRQYLTAYWDTFDRKERERPWPGTKHMSAREIQWFATHVDAIGYKRERERMEKSQESS